MKAANKRMTSTERFYRNAKCSLNQQFNPKIIPTSEMPKLAALNGKWSKNKLKDAKWQT